MFWSKINSCQLNTEQCRMKCSAQYAVQPPHFAIQDQLNSTHSVHSAQSALYSVTKVNWAQCSARYIVQCPTFWHKWTKYVGKNLCFFCHIVHNQCNGFHKPLHWYATLFKINVRQRKFRSKLEVRLQRALLSSTSRFHQVGDTKRTHFKSGEEPV